MPEAEPEAIMQESTRIFAQFPREEFEEPLDNIKALYKLESIGLTLRNCVRVALQLHDKNPEEFLQLLKN
jgi:hypothetical protein